MQCCAYQCCQGETPNSLLTAFTALLSVYALPSRFVNSQVEEALEAYHKNDMTE